MTATLYDDMDEAAKLAGGFVQPDPLTDFKVRADQIARRRALAQRLVAQAASDNGGSGMHGGVYMVGNQWGNVARDIGGAVMNRMADNDQQQLAAEQSRYDNDTLAAIPSEGPARQQAQLKAMQNPSLRDIIKAQMGIDENEAKRIEAGEQAAANRVEAEAKAEADRKARHDEGELNRQNRLDVRQTPTIHITQGNGGKAKPPMGYEWNGDELQPIKGGPKDPNAAPVKPVNLTAAQQKAVDDSDALLGYIDSALEGVKANPKAIGFKTVIPDMALSKIDPEGVATRAAVAGLSAERVHQLSGAAVSPAEFARLRPYLPASGDTSEAVTKKLTNLKAEVERIRASHMKGPTRAQPNAAERKTIGGVTYEKRGGQWFAL